MLVLVEQSLNGLQFGLLLFLLAAGLTLVFGIMDFVNLAHGSLYMMGAYFAATFVAWTNSFVLGILLALGATLLLGIALEFIALRHLYGRDHLDQVLATFGLILFFNDAVRLIWGPAGLSLPLPAWLTVPVQIVPGVFYPAYRLSIIVVALAVAALLYIVVMRTRIGMLIRAGASNREMIGALGINIKLLFTLVFGLGAALAGLAGLMQAPILTVQIGMGENILILAFVIIVIGGIGSIRGAFLAAIFVGMIDTLGRAFLPDLLRQMLSSSAASTAAPALSSMLIYLVMAIALVVGALSLRTRGVYFIMITLAFAQMAYYIASGLARYGGDDGLTVYKRSDFAGLINLSSRVQIYYLCLACLFGGIYLVWRIINSRFGMVVQGLRSNEQRMQAIGFPASRYRLVCFVIAGTMCGLAGALLANNTDFVSPAVMYWTRSGDLMVMVILGGMGSLFGPMIGAIVYLLLEELLSQVTEYWALIMGPLLLLIVLFGRGGIFGLLGRLRRG